MTIKDISRAELESLTDLQLYNLLFGPAAELKKETLSCDNDFVVAVYGATMIPMNRRINALLELINEKKVANIILSGGIGWLGINLLNKSIDELRTMFKDPNVFKRIYERTITILEYLPEFRNKVYMDCFGIDFEGMDHDEIVSYIIGLMYEDSKINNFITGLYKNSNVPFNEWLNSNLDMIIKQYIINVVTESEIMQFDLLSKANVDSKITLEAASFNTVENAKNTLLEFVKIQKETGVSTLVIINEWPYLHRAVLTTQKVADAMGINVKVIGYPAKFSQDKEWYYQSPNEFRYNKVSGTIENLTKESIYRDCGNFKIDKYLSSDYVCDNIPPLVVGESIFNGSGCRSNN